MRRRLSIMNVGGHPKDAILMAGGTLAKHVARGDRVCTLSLTHGVRSHHEVAIAETKAGREAPDVRALVEERDRELVEAANELGVTDVRFLRHDDEIVLLDRKMISDIADVIGDVRPDIIITHYPYDSVPNHANAGQMTLLAMDAASGIRADKPYPPHKVSQVFYNVQMGRLNVQENALPRVPTTLIDITDVIQKKLGALNHFRSQYYGEASPLGRKLGEVLDGFYGIYARVPYAEAFVAHNPQVFDSLPLSEYGLELSAKTSAETIEHMSQMVLTG